MVPQGQLVAAHLSCQGVEGAPLQPGADGAVGGVWSPLLSYDVVVPRLFHVAGETVFPQMVLDDVAAVAGVAGVDGDCHQLVLYGSPPPQFIQDMEQGVGVFPARHAHGNPVPLLYQPEVCDCPAHGIFYLFVALVFDQFQPVYRPHDVSFLTVFVIAQTGH